MSLESQVAEFFTAGREAIQESEPERLHAFRIATKRLRYTIELTEPEDRDPFLKQLKHLQEVLGSMNDAFVAECYLREQPKLSVRAHPLPDRLHRKAIRHIRDFRGYWRKQFDAPGEEERWLEWARQ